MQCIVLPHITASVFINDDESGLHYDNEPSSNLRTGCGLKGWRCTRRSTSAGPEAGCTTGRARTPILNEVTGTPTRT
jgi:hypothetical protein